MTFDEIAARFARGRVPNSEYLALTGELVRLGFRLYTPRGRQRHEWSRGRRQLRLAYDGISRTWAQDKASESEQRSVRHGQTPTAPPAPQ
jgi:hypothetical protein